MGTDHGHHSGELTNTPHMRHVLLAVLCHSYSPRSPASSLLWPSGEHPTIDGAERYDGTILDVRECQDGPDPECLEATVRVDSGPDDGTEVVVPVPYGAGVPGFPGRRRRQPGLADRGSVLDSSDPSRLRCWLCSSRLQWSRCRGGAV
jgi:hypothetical protein